MRKSQDGENVAARIGRPLELFAGAGVDLGDSSGRHTRDISWFLSEEDKRRKGGFEESLVRTSGCERGWSCGFPSFLSSRGWALFLKFDGRKVC